MSRQFVLGIHFEGPFISPASRVVHQRSYEGAKFTATSRKFWLHSQKIAMPRNNARIQSEGLGFLKPFFVNCGPRPSLVGNLQADQRALQREGRTVPINIGATA